MVHTRRRLLAALAGAGATGATAGCLGRHGDLPGGETATPAPCDAETQPDPSPEEGLPDPEPYPDRPDELTRESVRSYLEAYEQAHYHNRVLADLAADGHCVEHLSVGVLEVTVSRADGGFEGEVTASGAFSGITCPDATGTDTSTPLPTAHLAAETATYRVTDRRLRREGRTLACW